MHAEHNDTIKTSDTVLSEKNIPLTLLKGLCVRGSLRPNRTANILTPTLLAIAAFLSRSPGAAQPRAWGPSLSGCWFSLPHLISNSSDPPTCPTVEVIIS